MGYDHNKEFTYCHGKHRVKFELVKPMTPEENPYEIVDGKMVLKDRITLESFMKRVKEAHFDIYTYHNLSFSITTRHSDIITVSCKKHGDFKVSIGNHLAGRGCPNCKISKGEYLVSSYLKRHDITFECQKTFDGCVNPMTGRKLRFDFYIPSLNLLIEFDGAQHYKPSQFGSSKDNPQENLLTTKVRDRMKDNFAVQSGIPLLRIPYTRIDHIDEILDKYITANLANSFAG